MRARSAVAVLGFFAMVLSSGVARAGINDDSPNPAPTGPTGVGTITNNTPVAIVVDGPDGNIATYRSPGRRANNGPRWTCRYYETIASLGTTAVSAGPDKTKPLPTLKNGEFYWLECVDDKNEVTYSVLIMWNPANPLGAIAAASRAAEQAEQALPLADPVIHSNPPENTKLLVGLDTWFRVDTPWQPQSTQATISAITATVTAIPKNVTWDFGDGTPPVTCDGPGKAFETDTKADTNAATQQLCSHTYTQRSTKADAGGTFTVTATVSYDVTWTATDGTNGTLEPVTRTSTVALRVQEAQAVIE